MTDLIDDTPIEEIDVLSEDTQFAVAGVSSVNGKTGEVVLSADDILVKNSQSIQSNLERIDEELGRLEDDKQDKLTAGENITIDENNVISATGGSGTTDYEDLDNKPTIDGVELRKGSTHSELGLLGTTDKDELEDKIDTKQDELIAGENITIENNVISATGGGTGNVDDVQINGESIVENKVANIEAEEAEAVDVDTEVTSGSNNLITSGAVYNVVGNIEAVLDEIRGV